MSGELVASIRKLAKHRLDRTAPGPTILRQQFFRGGGAARDEIADEDEPIAEVFAEVQRTQLRSAARYL